MDSEYVADNVTQEGSIDMIRIGTMTKIGQQ